jgi:hypothetical protein
MRLVLLEGVKVGEWPSFETPSCGRLLRMRLVFRRMRFGF